MKTIKPFMFAVLTGFMLCLSLLTGCNGAVLSHAENDDIVLIQSFVTTVNGKDVDAYILLFSEEIRAEMCAFVEARGAESFFAEINRELLDIAKVSDAYIKENAWLFGDVHDRFDAFDVYYVTERISFDRSSGTAQEGTQTNLYIIVTEDGEKKLYRISATPVIDEKYLTE